MAERRYPGTDYERAADALADAAEDLLTAEESEPGQHQRDLEEAWLRFAKVATNFTMDELVSDA